MNKYDEVQKNQASAKALRIAMDVLIGIRRIERISVDTVAEKGNFSKSTITKVEREDSPISVTYDLLNKYCRGVDVEFSTIVRFIDSITNELLQNGMKLKANTAREKLFRFLQMTCS